MKKILYILLFFSCSLFGQHQTMLLASQEQFANEGGGVDIFPQSNVLSLVLEADALPVNSVSNTTISVAGVGKTDTTTAQNGSYSILAINDGFEYGNFNILVDLEGGSTYQIDFYLKLGTSTNIRVSGWTGFNVSPDINTGTTPATWTLYQNTVTVSGTGTVSCVMKFYPDFGTINKSMYLDSFSITQL